MNNINIYNKKLDYLIQLADLQTTNLQNIQSQNSNIMNVMDRLNDSLNKLIYINKDEEIESDSFSEIDNIEEDDETYSFISLIDSEFEESESEEKSESSQLTKKMLRRQNCKEFHWGYMGEGYVYEELNRFGCFSKVVWNAKTTNINNPSITLNNHNKYYIQEDGDHYDMYAEDENGIKYYFEIKSTCKQNRSCSISRKQKEFAQTLESPIENFVIAVVQKVNSDPSIDYYLYPYQTKLNISKKYNLVQCISEFELNENVDDNKIVEVKKKKIEKKPVTDPFLNQIIKPKIENKKAIKEVSKSKKQKKLVCAEVQKQKNKSKKAKSKSSGTNSNVSKMLLNIKFKTEKKQKKRKKN